MEKIMSGKEKAIKGFELRIDYYLSMIEMNQGEGKTLENKRKGFEKSIKNLNKKIEDVKNAVETVSPYKTFRAEQKEALKAFLTAQKLEKEEWKKANGYVEPVKKDKEKVAA